WRRYHLPHHPATIDKHALREGADPVLPRAHGPVWIKQHRVGDAPLAGERGHGLRVILLLIHPQNDQSLPAIDLPGGLQEAHFMAAGRATDPPKVQQDWMAT